FALHAVRFTVDDRGHWRTAGREAVRTVLELVQQPLRGRLVRSDAFAHVLAACKDVAIAPVLARAGRHRGSELPGGWDDAHESPRGGKRRADRGAAGTR